MNDLLRLIPGGASHRAGTGPFPPGVSPSSRVTDLSAGQLADLVEMATLRALRAAAEPEPSAWLTTKQAAVHASRSAKTITKWVNDGLVDVRKGGGRAGNRISRASLDAYLGRDRSSVSAGSSPLSLVPPAGDSSRAA